MAATWPARILGALALLGALLLGPGPAVDRAAAEDALRGVFLVADPDLRDPHFRQTVVLVTRHHGGAPVGVILNRPTTTSLGPLVPSLPRLHARTEPVFVGGPVAPQVVVFVFRSPDRPPEALHVAEGAYMTLNGRLLDDLLGRPLGVLDLRAFAGYASWVPGQLEAEIGRGVWHMLPADPDTIFRKDTATLWKDLLRRATSRTVWLQPRP